jgi:hypothetical protein
MFLHVRSETVHILLSKWNEKSSCDETLQLFVLKDEEEEEIKNFLALYKLIKLTRNFVIKQLRNDLDRAHDSEERKRSLKLIFTVLDF